MTKVQELIGSVRASWDAVRSLVYLTRVDTSDLLIMSAVVEWELGRRLGTYRDEGLRQACAEMDPGDLDSAARVLDALSTHFHGEHPAHDWLRIVEAERASRGTPCPS